MLDNELLEREIEVQQIVKNKFYSLSIKTEKPYKYYDKKALNLQNSMDVNRETPCIPVFDINN